MFELNTALFFDSRKLDMMENKIEEKS